MPKSKVALVYKEIEIKTDEASVLLPGLQSANVIVRKESKADGM